MNTKIKFTRLVLALLIALGALGISTSTALADRPSKVEFPWTTDYVLADVCPFSIEVHANMDLTITDYYDNNGVFTREKQHVIEQDTFTANGNTLVGMLFTFNIEINVDNDGNLTLFRADGVAEKIPLPNGDLFISAGQIDWLAHPGATFILSPDRGHTGDIDAFCAALAP